jgi:hypothetical protein
MPSSNYLRNCTECEYWSTQGEICGWCNIVGKTKTRKEKKKKKYKMNEQKPMNKEKEQ